MNTHHDPALPKYQQLARFLQQQIQQGHLQPGDQLPTEEQLCRAHGLSRGTVRQAIHVLEQQGLLKKVQGRGTFVTDPGARSTFFTLTSFAEDMRRQGRTPSTRVLAAERVLAPPPVRKKLELAAEEPVFRVERLRLADGQPVMHETRWLAARLCPDLLQHDLSQTIHTLLIEQYDLPLVRTVHTVEIRLLHEHEAALLASTPGTPAFYVDRLTFTTGASGQRPAVWYVAIYRGDEYHFRAEFEPPHM